MELTFGVPEADTGEVHTDLAGGFDSKGAYVLLNQFDQDTVLTGGGVVLGLAMCTAFAPACSAVTVLVGAAPLYLSYNGKCSNNRQLMLPIGGIISGVPPFYGHQVHCV